MHRFHTVVFMGVLACGLFVITLAGAAPAEVEGNPAAAKVLLYLPFDGSTDAKIAGGKAEALAIGPVTYGKGKKGQAVRASRGPLLYEVEGNMKRDRGTIMMWVKTPWDVAGAGWDGLFDSVYPGKTAQCMLLAFHPGVKAWRFGIGAPAKMECYSKKMTDWEANRWYHVIVTWDIEAGAAIYIDGKLSGRGGATKPGTRVTAIEQLYVGASALKGSRGRVFIDEFYIYDRALDEGQIAVIYKRQCQKETDLGDL